MIHNHQSPSTLSKPIQTISQTRGRKCPLCKNNNHKLLFQHELEDFDQHTCFQTIRVSCCDNCGFILNDTEIPPEELNMFYSRENQYLSDTSFGTGGINTGDMHRYETYLSILSPYVTKDTKICDVGCAKGGLLKFLQNAGFHHVYGVEINPKLVNLASDDGLNVQLGDAAHIPQFHEEAYECLIFSHVFEHLLDFDSVLQSISESLVENGLVFIEVPNATSYKDASPFDFYWFFATKEHVNHFSSHYLNLLMQSKGLECIDEIQYLMPYNNHDYYYPSLMMLFRKKQAVKLDGPAAFCRELSDRIQLYMDQERSRMEFHSKIIDRLVYCQTPIYCWGIGAEFLTVCSFTSIEQCNLVHLVDKNVQKQDLTFKGRPILPPDVLKTERNHASVLIFSAFNNKAMKKYIEDINYSGDIIVFD